MASPTLPNNSNLPKQFLLFTHLPTELRLKIYTLSLPSSRLVPIHYLSPTRSPLRNSPYHTIHQGCTSPAPIPALLHVSREARSLAQEHYSLLFPLCGPPTSFPSKIWFRTRLSESGDSHDILYFPSVPSTHDPHASSKHFEHACMLLHPASLAQVHVLAVHEDIFLEYSKRRRALCLQRGQEGGEGIDGMTGKCLRDFWEGVRRRFRNVEEIVFVGEGREDDVLSEEERRISASEMTMGSRGRKRGESFEEKIGRVVLGLEAETGWVAPRWRVLSPRETRDVEMVDCPQFSQLVSRVNFTLVDAINSSF